MKTTQEMIEVMQHYANGGEIEYRSLFIVNPEVWHFSKQSIPRWDWDNYDYRIAQPKKKKVKMLCWFDTFTLRWVKEGATITASSKWTHIPHLDHIIEVKE